MATAQSGPVRQAAGVAADELVEVFDEDGRVVEVVSRARMRAERLRHRCTFVVVRRPTGEVLVHRRSPDKDVWPDRWDLAAGGVVQAGEAWDGAAARELAEEVGVRGVPLVPLVEGDVTYEDDDVAEVARLYTTTWDGPVSFDDGEVVEARWVTVDELRRLVVEERFVADSIALVLPHVLD